MKVLHENPPNFAAINSKFNIAGKPIAFTYGDTVYVPTGHDLADHIQAHEQVHINQQRNGGTPAWWERYLADPQFRFEQELEAYQVQYKFILENCNRDQRRKLLKKIATDLSGAMYGNIVSYKQAEEAIKGGTGSF